MRSFVLPALILSLVVGLTAGFVFLANDATKLSPQNQLVFPVEVMHHDVFGEHAWNEPLSYHGGNSPRHVETVTFEVSGSPGELWLWGHHIGFQYFWDHFEWDQGAGDAISNVSPISSDYDAPYDGRAKASVRINGGDWVDITNDNVTCAYPESEQFCIGGVTNTQRFKVDGSQLQQGENTVEFAFLGHDMLSSGYRILDMVALPAGYDGSLSHREVRNLDLITSSKTHDYLDLDPPSGADPSQGATLWHADNSLLDFPGGPEIIASCNDCHAQDGRDMEFFGYSNESIIVRSRHHGLSQQEGEHIAAYIRSQDLKYEDGTSYSWRSRPWNPPYQPGPAGHGPDNEHPDVANAQYWAGGAGLEWVADHDNETIPYLFNDGTGNPQAGPFVDPPDISIQTEMFRVGAENPLNLREIPLDVQLPDWNSWLPIIHPRDALGDDAFFGAVFRGRNVWDHYQQVRSDGTSASVNDVHLVAGNARGGWRDGVSIIDNHTAWQRNSHRHRRAVSQWASVKMFELHHEFFHSDRPARGDFEREPRSWVTNSRPLFNIASHIAENNTDAYLDGPPIGGAGRSLSHLWYHYQLITSGSETQSTGQSPIDWNYQQMYMRAFAGDTGLPGVTRAITTAVKKDQMLGGIWGLDVMRGFNHHRHGLYQFNRDVNSSNIYGEVDQSLLGDILGAYLSSWAWFVNEWDIEDFPRSESADDCAQVERNSWGHPDHNPRLLGFGSGGTFSVPSCDQQGSSHLSNIHWLDDNYDIPATTLDSLARFGQDMWSEPQSGSPSWETWILDEDYTPPLALDLELSEGTNEQSAPANFTFTAEPSNVSADITLVEFYVNDQLYAEVDTAPYTFNWNDVVEGTYEVVARAYDADGESATSNTLTVSVSEQDEDPPDAQPPSVDVTGIDVGPVGVEGSWFYNDGTYTIQGGGSDIWSSSDEFHFLHKEVSGDGVIVARLNDQENTHQWAKAGVMIRESLSSDAVHAMTIGTPENGARLQHRAEAGSGSSDTALDGAVSAPIWLRLEREGDTLTGMISHDGETWESESSVSLDLPETVFVGLAVTSHDNSVVSTALFDNLFLSWTEESNPTQVLNLDAGWNLVARYVQPADADMEVLWEAIGDTLVLVKNAAGANYFPEFGINEIGAWRPDEAYMVFVTDPAELTITGEQLPLEQRTVELAEGWSYAPYRGTAPLEAEEAFAGLSSLLLAVDQEGGVYFPGEGLNTIGTLLPGRGYRVFMMAAEVWELPEAADEPAGASLVAGQRAQSSFSPSASILLLDAPLLPSGRQVDLLTADSMVVGTGVVEQGRAAIVVAAEEELVSAGTGAQTGQPLVLRTGQETLSVAQVQDVLSGGVSETLTFAPNTVLHVHLGTDTQEVALHQSYPNPAHRAATVPLEVPVEGPVRLRLYDALGRQVRTLLDRPLTPGRHEVHVDVSDLASGVYHYRLRAGDARASGRMTVVR